MVEAGRARARVAFAMMWLLARLVGHGLSGVDQLIGAGITLFLDDEPGLGVVRDLRSRRHGSGLRAGLERLRGRAALVLAARPALAFSQLVNGTAFAVTCWLFSRMLYATKGARLRAAHHDRAPAHRGSKKRIASSKKSERGPSECCYAVLPAPYCRALAAR